MPLEQARLTFSPIFSQFWEARGLLLLLFLQPPIFQSFSGEERSVIKANLGQVRIYPILFTWAFVIRDVLRRKERQMRWIRDSLGVLDKYWICLCGCKKMQRTRKQALVDLATSNGKSNAFGLVSSLSLIVQMPLFFFVCRRITDAFTL